MKEDEKAKNKYDFTSGFGKVKPILSE